MVTAMPATNPHTAIIRGTTPELVRAHNATITNLGDAILPLDMTVDFDEAGAFTAYFEDEPTTGELDDLMQALGSGSVEVQKGWL